MPVLLEAGNRAFGDLLPSTLRLVAKPFLSIFFGLDS